MASNDRQPAVMTHFDRQTFALLVEHDEGWCIACRHLIPGIDLWHRGGRCPVCDLPCIWGAAAALHDELIDFDPA
jgi:hypothetical protein